ncbi:hypothetical protein GE061_015553 [Apolygus lucorum]|uniref:YqaJ viral recombinase domain-containing protein n=1 Tax=Apolygus lucorum TaxID=248454 RepID=A0A8S9XLH1_APOLU|nr:hypothetical protein GE061_015553 [Apolygus lucorum]
MKRGKILEEEVIRTVSNNFERYGMFLDGQYPIYGASPDAIDDTRVYKVKCPSNEKTMKEYLSNNRELSKKCMGQIQLQMLLAKKDRGLFCVADPNFEQNKKVTTLERRKIKEELMPHEIPEVPFYKIAADIGEYGNGIYLFVVDYYSRWLEIVKIKDKTAKSVIDRLKELEAESEEESEVWGNHQQDQPQIDDLEDIDYEHQEVQHDDHDSDSEVELEPPLYNDKEDDVVEDSLDEEEQEEYQAKEESAPKDEPLYDISGCSASFHLTEKYCTNFDLGGSTPLVHQAYEAIREVDARCGLIPLDRQPVLEGLLGKPGEADSSQMDTELINMLKELRGSDEMTPRKSKRVRMAIEPGKS